MAGLIGRCESDCYLIRNNSSLTPHPPYLGLLSSRRVLRRERTKEIKTFLGLREPASVAILFLRFVWFGAQMHSPDDRRLSSAVVRTELGLRRRAM
jgi:hypothetical protein